MPATSSYQLAAGALARYSWWEEKFGAAQPGQIPLEVGLRTGPLLPSITAKPSRKFQMVNVEKNKPWDLK